jgi:hypothetical protein
VPLLLNCLSESCGNEIGDKSGPLFLLAKKATAMFHIAR